MGAVRINQMGYSPNSTKRIVYVGEGDTFSIYRAKEQEAVYCGRLKEYGPDENSGDYLRTGDFSTLCEPGDYYIRINQDRSPVFTVSEQQNVICTDALLKAFYYQRCGVELTEQYAGRFSHPACHLTLSHLFCQEAEHLLRTSPELPVCTDSAGGWHDAGDYGRYTIATIKAVADLLLAYEQHPKAFRHPVGIPVNELPGPDILREAKVGLDFLFKMQRSDGAVHTKAATRYFSGVIMPQEDRAPIFVFGISSPATADFAAVMAMAAQIYGTPAPDYAAECLRAAKAAYGWLKKNPEPLLFKNPPDIDSGEYGDSCDTDERYWAAAQMYRTTGEERYHEDFLSFCNILKDRLSFGWRDVGGYGTIAYLFSQRPRQQELYENLKNEWLNHARLLEERSRKDGYGITLASQEYVWGSNMVLMNQSMQLIMADALQKTSVYEPVIQSNWDYLFGKNPSDISYVTGLGERAVSHPHHRPSEADGIHEPVPGLVAGGPCAALLDEVAREQCQGLPPAKCYIDHCESFSTNEIDIYWNSPAVYVGSYFAEAEVGML